MAEKVNYEQLKRSGFVRQKQDGYFSLRLHVVGGSLTAENFAALSKIATEFGNGDLHLTSRQGVEVPYIKLEDIESVRQRLSENNLEPASIGPCVRTVTACPGSALCRSGNIDTQKI
ncbi:MAG: hypothetical protein IJV62_03190, partial [Eggerthellaceae bacterium]|nr:hypothetical protein [Eggerthellaceae bacterium]